MDTERTMQFILDQQAATAVKLDQVAERLDQMGERLDQMTDRLDQMADRLDKLADRQDKTDRQIAAIQKLILTGMKMMVRRDKITDDRINALIDAQQRTERKLDRLIQGVGRGRNGRNRH